MRKALLQLAKQAAGSLLEGFLDEMGRGAGKYFSNKYFPEKENEDKTDSDDP